MKRRESIAPKGPTPLQFIKASPARTAAVDPPLIFKEVTA
jgi:hypothetical protein